MMRNMNLIRIRVKSLLKAHDIVIPEFELNMEFYNEYSNVGSRNLLENYLKK